MFYITCCVMMEAMQNKQKISKEMVLLDVLTDYPQTEAVIKAYDEQAGECICCQMLFESLKKIIEKYQLDGDKLLKQLNDAAAS